MLSCFQEPASGELAAEEIELCYFEPGHSFMSADSYHHQVELSLKNQGKVYDFYDFQKAIESSRKSQVEAKPMDFSDIYLWQDFSSAVKKRKETTPYLSQIVRVKAVRGLYTLKYKTSFGPDESFN